MTSESKKYSLVKWLENSQFDVNNEWLGRITSVSHTNIIDFDADELKTGMEISIFRNGEIWRAMVIIPKTTMNTVDLPPSSNKIRTIVLPIQKDTETNNLNDRYLKNQISTFQELSDLNENDVIEASSIEPKNNCSNTCMDMMSKNLLKNSNQEWQFIQSTISDTSIAGIFEPCNHNNNNATLVPNQNITNFSNSNVITNAITLTDLNVETILQMQCELLDHQRELKTIEMETIEQLKLLHRNVTRLAKKFDLLEKNFNVTNDIVIDSDNQQKKKLNKKNTKNKNANSLYQEKKNQNSLNKFLKDSVQKKCGSDFLLHHSISDIPSHIMKSIKKEAFEKYLTRDHRPIKAWCLAMSSLRCLKRDITKNKFKQKNVSKNCASVKT